MDFAYTSSCETLFSSFFSFFVPFHQLFLTSFPFHLFLNSSLPHPLSEVLLPLKSFDFALCDVFSHCWVSHSFLFHEKKSALLQLKICLERDEGRKEKVRNKHGSEENGSVIKASEKVTCEGYERKWKTNGRNKRLPVWRRRDTLSITGIKH